MDNLKEYVNEYKDLLTSLEKEKMEILDNLNYSKKHAMEDEMNKQLQDPNNRLSYDEKIMEAENQVEKYKFIYDLQLKGAEASVKYFIQAYNIAEKIVGSTM